MSKHRPQRRRTPAASAQNSQNSTAGVDARENLERAMGIEPTTYSLGSCRSTTELRPRRRVCSVASLRPKGAAEPSSLRARRIDPPSLRLLFGAGQERGFRYRRAEPRLYRARQTMWEGQVGRAGRPSGAAQVERPSASCPLRLASIRAPRIPSKPPNKLNAFSFLRRKGPRKRLLGCASRPK